MQRILHVAIAAAFLSSCAMFERHQGHGHGHGPMGHRPPENCKQGRCTFKVTVSSCSKNGIDVDKDPIVVEDNYRGVIEWELDTPGWSFADNGIDIDQGSDDEFDGKQKQPKKFKWNNKHNQKHKDYKYTINVIRDGTTQVCSKDPTIMN